jgi:3'-5' exoribonuclease
MLNVHIRGKLYSDVLKKKSTDQISDGEMVDDIFIARARGDSIVLMDSGTGALECHSDHWPAGIRGGAVVHVIGRAVYSAGRMRILCDSIETLEHGTFTLEGLLKPPRRDPEEMRRELFSAIESVEDEETKALLNEIFGSSEMERFFVYPGALEIHHAWTSGLLQHTLEVLKCALLAGDMNGMSRDLLTAGALLHDVGKVFELDDGIRISREGALLGHITQGIIYVSKKCDTLNMSGERRDKILHIIASHYGKLEYGSPKEPMFPEAFAVYYGDELSAKLSRIMDFVSAQDGTEDFAYSARDRRSIFLR